MYTLSDVYCSFFSMGKDKDMAKDMIGVDADELADLFFEHEGKDDYSSEEYKAVKALHKDFIKMLNAEYKFYVDTESDTGHTFYNC